MSKQSYFQRYSLIIKRLQNRKATFEEINDFLKQGSASGDSFELSKRTFQRDVEEIRSLYNIDIQFDFRLKVYFIDDAGQSDFNIRLLESFDMINAINMAENVSKYVLPEIRKANGTEHFSTLIQAIKDNHIVSFTYFKFEDETLSKRKVEPCVLKEFKGRWYLLAKDLKDNSYKTFGTDRITELEILKTKFKPNKGFNPAAQFENCFGISNDTDKEPEEIILSFTRKQGLYVKSYPLHSSQTIVAETDNEIRILLFLIHTWDLEMELLSYGEDVKIIKPASLRKVLKRRYKKASGY